MPRHWLGAVVLLVATAASAGTLPKASAPVSPASAIVLAPKASAPIAAISAVAPVHEPRESRENSANIDPVSGEKPVDWFARIAASIGILLGIGNVFFAIWKLTRDRRLSVEDDFWFRKIVAPATIEPLLKGVMQLLQEMPVNRSSPDDLSAYARKITTEFQKLYPAMQTLGLIDSSWPKLVIDKLRACEDALTEHVGEIINSDPMEQPGSVELQNSVLEMLNEALHAIKDGHLKK